IGGPFQPYTFNDDLTKAAAKRFNDPKGTKDPQDALLAKGRYHCLVCEFGLKPVVAVFVREDPEAKGEGNEAVVQELLTKGDDAVERHRDTAYLHAFAVYLTPDARSSLTEKKIDDTERLVNEATAREKLTKRLAEVAEPLKHVVVGFYPAENLKGYEIAKQP